MSDYDFYDAQSEASQIKTRIVTKYFWFWSRVMISHARRQKCNLAYFDLYAGPGQYKDGTPSTPLIILEQAIADPSLRKLLVTYFNDNEHAETLRENIYNLPGVSTLSHPPIVSGEDVDSQFEQIFSSIRLVPSFTFIDPFGYKGVTLALMEAVLKDWGCELVLFFSYNRINAAIENKTFDEHTEKLFGRTRLRNLRSALVGRRPFEREALILDAFARALKEMGFEFVLPFTFKRSDMKRTSHHLIFISKHPLAYTVMKEIMAKESTDSTQGVASFSYTKSLSRDETPLLYVLDRPIDELGEDLLEKFAGRTMSMKQVFKRHHIGSRFVEKNYKTALLQLEADRKIQTSPPPSKRKGNTFGDMVSVTFPNR